MSAQPFPCGRSVVRRQTRMRLQTADAKVSAIDTRPDPGGSRHHPSTTSQAKGPFSPGEGSLSPLNLPPLGFFSRFTIPFAPIQLHAFSTARFRPGERLSTMRHAALPTRQASAPALPRSASNGFSSPHTSASTL